MPEPVASAEFYTQLATDYAVIFAQKRTNFIGQAAAAQRSVLLPSERYYFFDPKSWLRNSMRPRIPGTESQGTGFAMSTDYYNCTVYSEKIDLTDQLRAAWNIGVVSAEQACGEYLSQKGLQCREGVFVSKYFNTGKWQYDLNGAIGDFTPWDNLTASDPIADVLHWCRMVQLAGAGFRPNIAIMSRLSFDCARQNPQILARITGGATKGDPASVSKELLAQLFELEEIFVADAVTETGEESALTTVTPGTPSFAFGPHMLLLYRPNAQAPFNPSAVTTFAWTGGTMQGLSMAVYAIPMPWLGVSTVRYEIQLAWDDKVTARALGLFAQNICSVPAND